MARSKNPRRVLIAELREWRGFLGRLIDFWNVAGRVAEVQSEAGRVVNHTWRERRYEEYRENDPRNWTKMAQNAEAMADRFRDIAEFCRQEAHSARQRQEGRA